MSPANAVDEATTNLLQHCAGLNATKTLLIVSESADFGWYDAEVGSAIAAAARAAGIATQDYSVGAPDNGRDARLAAAMQQHDCTLFLSRIGDQDRFASQADGKTIVMSYLRTRDMLESQFARLAYPATLALKQSLDGIIRRATRLEISCPAGTLCSQTKSPQQGSDDAAQDVTVLRFPLGVVTPIEAGNLSGRVALCHFLTPTGSKVYQPPNLVIDKPVFAHLEAGRITGFDGPTEIVTAVKQHYLRVARQFNIDAEVVHSWHVGMHPGLHYRDNAADDPDRWSNTIFNHPRILHFHTCGAYAPGEICWIVKDQTLRVDGKALWANGSLQLDSFAALEECLRLWPELERLYRRPLGAIGL